jgi:carboxyl-terminal processing protease
MHIQVVIPTSTLAACLGLVRRMAAVALALAAVAWLSGCASKPSFQTEAYSEADTQQLFEEAFSRIQDRYIEPVVIGSLALAGMRDLLAAQNNPSLRLQVSTDTVLLINRGTELAKLERPDGHDADGWAEVTAAVVQRARAAEPSLQALPAEAIYRIILNGGVGLLDRFSRYATAAIATQQRAAREGFDGIGILIQTLEGITRVIEVLEGTPAQGGGLAVGDHITHVDDIPLAGLDAAAVIELMRGPPGSRVALDLLRGNIPPRAQQVSVYRAYIVPVSVHTNLWDGLALIQITSFNRNTARDLEQQFSGLSRKNVRGLILDLRGNPVGLLDQAVLTADLFLSGGVIISTFGRHAAASSIFTADTHQIAAGLPMVVLINGDSASSAELLAAALQDRGRAVIIGTTTHGKGSVQNLARLPNGGELIITWSRLHAPSGYILDGLGVLPNICTAEAMAPNNFAQVFASMDAYASRMPRWHRYDHIDPPLAAALRTACPAGVGDHTHDLELAQRLLRDPALYARALRPALSDTAAAVLPQASAS